MIIQWQENLAAKVQPSTYFWVGQPFLSQEIFAKEASEGVSSETRSFSVSSAGTTTLRSGASEIEALGVQYSAKGRGKVNVVIKQDSNIIMEVTLFPGDFAKLPVTGNLEGTVDLTLTVEGPNTFGAPLYVMGNF